MATDTLSTGKPPATTASADVAPLTPHQAAEVILRSVTRARSAIAVWVAACLGVDEISQENVSSRQVGAAVICNAIQLAESSSYAALSNSAGLELLHAKCTIDLIDEALWNYAIAELEAPPEISALIETARLADGCLAEFMTRHGDTLRQLASQKEAAHV